MPFAPSAPRRGRHRACAPPLSYAPRPRARHRCSARRVRLRTVSPTALPLRPRTRQVLRFARSAPGVGSRSIALPPTFSRNIHTPHPPSAAHAPGQAPDLAHHAAPLAPLTPAPLRRLSARAILDAPGCSALLRPPAQAPRSGSWPGRSPRAMVSHGPFAADLQRERRIPPPTTAASCSPASPRPRFCTPQLCRTK
jgi:hypothetical protein